MVQIWKWKQINPEYARIVWERHKHKGACVAKDNACGLGTKKQSTTRSSAIKVALLLKKADIARYAPISRTKVLDLSLMMKNRKQE
jgi:hypothetical protein